MPFKTRKQKEAAAQRRFTFSPYGTLSWGSNIGKSTDDVENVNRGEGSDLGRRKALPIPHKFEVENLSYVRLELIKIVLFASLIFTTQLLLRLTLP